MTTAGTSEAVPTTLDVDSSESALTENSESSIISEPDGQVSPSQRGLKKGHGKRQKMNMKRSKR